MSDADPIFYGYMDSRRFKKLADAKDFIVDEAKYPGTYYIYEVVISTADRTSATFTNFVVSNKLCSIFEILRSRAFDIPSLSDIMTDAFIKASYKVDVQVATSVAVERVK